MSNFPLHPHTSKALRLTAFAVCIGIAMSACKKTEIVPYERDAQNHIVEYKVTNVEGTINGVVDNTDNTITVYLPYYVSLNYIIPKITLETGARLINKAGDEIDIREDLEPVNIDSTNYTYSVKDAKDVIRTYKLITTIVPFKDPLKLGYAFKDDGNGNYVADTEVTLDALAYATFPVYGNFESSSKNGKATLIKNSNNTVVPNGLKILNVTRAQSFHFMTLQVSADIDSGYYHVVIEHQGRKDTLPALHVIYKRPQFKWLTKTWTVGDTVSLDVVDNDGVNTGIKRAYMKFKSVHYNFTGTYVPTGFPKETMFDVPIVLEMVSQSRTNIKFKFPNITPGLYSQWISSGSNRVEDSALGIYLDFNSATWGNDVLSSSAPYLMEVLAKP